MPTPPPPEEGENLSLIGEAAERMYTAHPKKKNLSLIPLALAAALNGATNLAARLAEIETCHSAWVTTENWTKSNGNYAPPLDQWLADRGFTKWPAGMRPPVRVPKIDPSRLTPWNLGDKIS